MSLKNSSPRFKAYTVFILFLILAFLLPAVRGQGDSRLYILVGAVPLFVLVFSVVCTRLFSLDRLLVLLSLTLCTMNILAPAAAEPDAALLRALSAAGSLIFLLAGSLLIRSFRPSSSAALVFLIPSLLLLLAPMISVPDDFFASLSKPGAVLLLIPVVSFLSLRSSLRVWTVDWHIWIRDMNKYKTTNTTHTMQPHPLSPLHPPRPLVGIRSSMKKYKKEPFMPTSICSFRELFGGFSFTMQRYNKILNYPRTSASFFPSPLSGVSRGFLRLNSTCKRYLISAMMSRMETVQLFELFAS